MRIFAWARWPLGRPDHAGVYFENEAISQAAGILPSGLKSELIFFGLGIQFPFYVRNGIAMRWKHEWKNCVGRL